MTIRNDQPDSEGGTAARSTLPRHEQVDRMLAPACVAVVGASERPGWGRKTIENLEAIGYPGSIFPVHPRHETVAGYQAYPRLGDLPVVPDVAVFAIPAEKVPEGVAEAAALGVPAAIVYASGFGAAGEGEGGQTSDESDRARLKAVCRGQIAVLGPNCLGAVDYTRRTALYGIVMPYSHAGADSGLALLVQSGNMGLTLSRANRGVRLTHLISCGNQLDLTMSELLEGCLRTTGVRAVAAVVEGVPDLDRFAAALTAAAEQDVPVIVLKIGRTEIGRAAALAHTGTLSGADALYRGYFRQYGAIQVDDLDQLLAVSALTTGPRRMRGSGVAVFSSSGGECGLVSDLAESAGVPLPQLTPGIAARLAARLPSFARPSNPLDFTAGGWANAELYSDLVATLAEQPGVAAVVTTADLPTLETTEANERFFGIVTGLVEGARRTGDDGPLLALLSTVGDVNRDVPLRCMAEGIVPLVGLTSGLTALSRAGWYAQWRERRATGNVPVAGDLGAAAAVQDLLARAKPGPLPEHVSKEIVGHYGIASPESRLVTDPSDAVSAAEALGYPVVVKVAAAGALHKSSLGGVVVGLRRPADVANAAERLLSIAKSLDPEAGRLLVEQHVEGGRELIVGGQRDPDFGAAVMVGLGGVHAESIADVTHRFGRLSPSEAAAMLGDLRDGRLFENVPRNGSIAADEFGRLVGAVSALLVDHPRIEALDLNPIVFDAGSGRFAALDALVIIGG